MPPLDGALLKRHEFQLLCEIIEPVDDAIDKLFHCLFSFLKCAVTENRITMISENQLTFYLKSSEDDKLLDLSLTTRQDLNRLFRPPSTKEKGDADKETW